jgi:hypothetical protein
MNGIEFQSRIQSSVGGWGVGDLEFPNPNGYNVEHGESG